MEATETSFFVAVLAKTLRFKGGSPEEKLPAVVQTPRNGGGRQ